MITQGTMFRFKGVGDAQIFDRGRWFEPDYDGIVVVYKTILKHTRAKGMAFIVELLVESSNHEKHPPGWKGSWFQKLVDEDIAFSNIKGWAAACAGFQSHEKQAIDAAFLAIANPQTGEKQLDVLLNEAVSSPDDNAFTRTRLHLVTTQIKTKAAGNPFTVYDFSPA
jgi:hypothetical protein